jgi:hypothetical protein
MLLDMVLGLIECLSVLDRQMIRYGCPGKL